MFLPERIRELGSQNPRFAAVWLLDRAKTVVEIPRFRIGGDQEANKIIDASYYTARATYAVDTAEIFLKEAGEEGIPESFREELKRAAHENLQIAQDMKDKAENLGSDIIL